MPADGFLDGLTDRHLRRRTPDARTQQVDVHCAALDVIQAHITAMGSHVLADLVEAALDEFVVDPSQGSHFFHNLTSFGIAYLSVNPRAEMGFIDWDWLQARPAECETDFVRHVRLGEPVGADNDVERPVGQPFDRLGLLSSGAESRKHGDLERKLRHPVRERLVDTGHRFERPRRSSGWRGVRGREQGRRARAKRVAENRRRFAARAARVAVLCRAARPGL